MKKIHKKLSDVSTKCGINLFSTESGLYLTDKWKIVTCKKCIAKRMVRE